MICERCCVSQATWFHECSETGRHGYCRYCLREMFKTYERVSELLAEMFKDEE